MIQQLHHIGVAVPSLEEALPKWVDGMGFTLQSTDEVPSEKVRVAVVTAGPTRVELLEPTSDESPIARYMAKRGPGIHHLAFQTDDCGAQIKVLADAGAPMLDETPRPGAHDTKCAFVHPKYLGGVLAELVEDPHNPVSGGDA